MFQAYRAVGILEDPGPPLKVRIGGRERPLLTKILAFVVVPLKHVRVYRRRRLIQREVDRVAAALAVELPGGESHPDFQSKVFDRVHEWLRDHPPALS
jgi:hypothetical protein